MKHELVDLLYIGLVIVWLFVQTFSRAKS